MTLLIMTIKFMLMAIASLITLSILAAVLFAIVNLALMTIEKRGEK